MTRQLNASTTSPSDWRYVSEGGSTIVFSYRGPEHQNFSGTVLRLRKTLIEDRSLIVDDSEADDPSIIFQNKIASQLIAASFLPRLESVHVEMQWLEALQLASMNVRPSQRNLKDKIDVCRRSAVLATDLVGGASLAVEIKPKWGFLPSPIHLSAATREIKTRRCRFCLHSRYRQIHGKETACGYCPLDLYSGDKQRIARALRHLLKAWVESSGSINNFRVFVDGKTTDPANFWRDDCYPLNERQGISGTREQRMEAFVDSLMPTVTDTPVFQKLAQLQRTLDPLDIEGLCSLYEIYRKNSPDPESVPSLEQLFPDPTFQDWEEFVSKYLTPEFQATLDHAHPESEHLRYYAMAYVLSATFKDCSVILRLGGSGAAHASVTVIDLDLKSMNRLKTWAELDHTLAISFEDDGLSHCLDATAAQQARSSVD